MSIIRFLSNQVYDTGAPGKGPTFAKGSILARRDVPRVLGKPITEEYAESFLQRWVNRGVAERITAEEAERAADDQSDGADPVKPTYGEMTRAELDALAAERAVDIASARNKGDVVAALELADEAAVKAASTDDSNRARN